MPDWWAEPLGGDTARFPIDASVLHATSTISTEDRKAQDAGELTVLHRVVVEAARRSCAPTTRELLQRAVETPACSKSGLSDAADARV